MAKQLRHQGRVWGVVSYPVREITCRTLLLLNVPARESVVFHDDIDAARPAQILCGVDLVIVAAPAFIQPSIDVGERYSAIVRLVNLEVSVAEDPGRRLPQRALTLAPGPDSGM